MRHRKKGKKLGREKASRDALIKSLAMSLVLYEKMKTTHAKAKVVRPFVERMITTGKNDTVAARRKIASILSYPKAVKKVFEVLGPRYKERGGGYTRIVRIGRRLGDGAEMAVIEFI